MGFLNPLRFPELLEKRANESQHAARNREFYRRFVGDATRAPRSRSSSAGTAASAPAPANNHAAPAVPFALPVVQPSHPPQVYHGPPVGPAPAAPAQRRRRTIDDVLQEMGGAPPARAANQAVGPYHRRVLRPDVFPEDAEKVRGMTPDEIRALRERKELYVEPDTDTPAADATDSGVDAASPPMLNASRKRKRIKRTDTLGSTEIEALERGEQLPAAEQPEDEQSAAKRRKHNAGPAELPSPVRPHMSRSALAASARTAPATPAAPLRFGVPSMEVDEPTPAKTAPLRFAAPSMEMDASSPPTPPLRAQSPPAMDLGVPAPPKRNLFATGAATAQTASSPGKGPVAPTFGLAFSSAAMGTTTAVDKPAASFFSTSTAAKSPVKDATGPAAPAPAPPKSPVAVPAPPRAASPIQTADTATSKFKFTLPTTMSGAPAHIKDIPVDQLPAFVFMMHGFGSGPSGSGSGSGSGSHSHSSQPARWTCNVCAVPNDASATRCCACEVDRPGSAGPSASAAPSTTSGGFSFQLPATTTAAPAPPTTSGISFGAAPTPATTASTQPALSFGGSTSHTGLSFGATSAQATTAPAQPGFSFGAAPTAPPASSTTAKSWTCDMCMVPNPDGATKCRSCETERPGAAPASSSAAPSAVFSFAPPPTTTASSNAFPAAFPSSTVAPGQGTGFTFGGASAQAPVAPQSPPPAQAAVTATSPAPAAAAGTANPFAAFMAKNAGKYTCDACMARYDATLPKCPACETDNPKFKGASAAVPSTGGFSFAPPPPAPVPTSAPATAAAGTVTTAPPASNAVAAAPTVNPFAAFMAKNAGKCTCDACMAPYDATLPKCPACEADNPKFKGAASSSGPVTSGFAFAPPLATSAAPVAPAPAFAAPTPASLAHAAPATNALAPPAAANPFAALMAKNAGKYTCEVCMTPYDATLPKCPACETDNPKFKGAASSAAPATGGFTFVPPPVTSTAPTAPAPAFTAPAPAASAPTTAAAPAPPAAPAAPAAANPFAALMAKNSSKYICNACMAPYDPSLPKCPACETDNPKFKGANPGASSAAAPAFVPPSSTSVAPGASLFGFGTPASAAPAPAAASAFGGGFSFAGTPAAAPPAGSAFGFGAANPATTAAAAAAPAFPFGASTAGTNATAGSTKGGFSFNQPAVSTAAAAPATGGFSFAQPAAPAAAAPATGGFSFNLPSSTASTAGPPASAFGGAAPSAFQSATGTSGGFNFGGARAPTAAAPSAFSFGGGGLASMPATPARPAGASAFNFGTPAPVTPIQNVQPPAFALATPAGMQTPAPHVFGKPVGQAPTQPPAFGGFGAATQGAFGGAGGGAFGAGAQQGAGAFGAPGGGFGFGFGGQQQGQGPAQGDDDSMMG
ncbi:hypothetical protein GGF32_004278 [Allomyces javanicus]|nr:hypothetical protein GGF32_004278 [Allomyces javanicus]